MHLLHTADWHLGQRLCDRDRQEEHAHFLHWLLKLMQEDAPDALLISGDIFDVGNPPNYALRQYYDFLSQASKLCPNIIITGGNHDSPATLNAPKELLRHQRVHVVGDATEDISEELIELRTWENESLGYVAAVPFLRDRAIRTANAGESYQEKAKQIAQGIQAHYQALAELLQDKSDYPCIAMGHLFAAGVDVSDSEKEIHVGNLGKVAANSFPKLFDYVALGHIHKPQIVGKQERIRYSGSPIPLSFSESKDEKLILKVGFEGGTLSDIQSLSIPLKRQLKRVSATKEDLEQAISDLAEKTLGQEVWLEVQVEDATHEPNLDGYVRDILAAYAGMELLSVRRNEDVYRSAMEEQMQSGVNLRELKVMEVFEKRCESANIEDTSELKQTFQELLVWMDEDEEVFG